MIEVELLLNASIDPQDVALPAFLDDLHRNLVIAQWFLSQIQYRSTRMPGIGGPSCDGSEQNQETGLSNRGKHKQPGYFLASVAAGIGSGFLLIEKKAS